MAEKQLNRYAEIVHSCTEDRYYKREIVLQDHSLVRVISGELKVIQGNSNYTFGTGDTILFPRNQLATLIKYPKDGQEYKAVVMVLTTSRLRDYYNKNRFVGHQPHNDKVMLLAKNALMESFFASLLPYFQLKDNLPEELSLLKMEEAITILKTLDEEINSILSDFSEPGKINLSEFMEKNYMFNVNLEKFSKLTGRSLSTFKRDFKTAFHTSPQKWLTQKRLELAHYQLSKGKRKLVEVYYETGFENLSHFSYAFKKHFGYPPSMINEHC